MKTLLFISFCVLSFAYGSNNPVLNSFATNAVVSQEQFQESKIKIKKIMGFVGAGDIRPEARDIFEKSVARQLKAENKLDAFLSMNFDDRKSLDTFTRTNLSVIINAFIETVDYCIPTNSYTGLKDIRNADRSIRDLVLNVKSSWSAFIRKYRKECWECIQPQIFSYNNDYNYNTNPAPGEVFLGITRFNKYIINKLVTDDNFFKEFRKYCIYHAKYMKTDFGMKEPLDEAYNKMSTDELCLLADEDCKRKDYYCDGNLMGELYGRYTVESYKAYEKYEITRQEKENWSEERKKDYDLTYKLKELWEQVEQHERLRKEAEKGKSEKQVLAEHKADLKQREEELKKMELDSDSEINLYFTRLENAQRLSEKYPKGRLYFDTGQYTRKIVKEAKPEFKETYWQYMNKKQEDTREDKLKQIIAGTAGAAFGKVMTEEDLPRAFDYMNAQRSFKLIEKLSFYKEIPPLAHKTASVSMLQQIIRENRTNMIVYFVTRYKKIKDPDVRRGFLAVAPHFGLTNYPKPFYP